MRVVHCYYFDSCLALFHADYRLFAHSKHSAGAGKP